jgi:hypothetical protein
MKAAEHKLRVLEIDEHFKPTPSSRNEARFQLLLVPEDDNNCTSNVPLVEGCNVWWVRTNKYTANIQHPSFFFVLVLFSFSFFKKLLGGTIKSVWHHVHSKHPAEVDQCGIKPRNQRETVLGDGTAAKCYSFDDEAQFEQSTLLLKRMLAVSC